MGRQVQVHGHGLAAEGKLEHVEGHPPHHHAAAHLRGLGAHRHGVQQVLGGPDAAEGEAQLHAQHVPGQIRIHARVPHLLLADQTVVAPIDVLHLGPDLVLGADEQGPRARVAGMAGQKHALEIQHLKHGELGQIGELTVLKQHVGQENGVGAGLVGHAPGLHRPDQAGLHEVLDAVGRTAAEYGQARVRRFDPVNAPADLHLANGRHPVPLSGARDNRPKTLGKSLRRFARFSFHTALFGKKQNALRGSRARTPRLPYMGHVGCGTAGRPG